MNVLDENFPDDQRQLLQRRRNHVHKIARDMGRSDRKAIQCARS